MAVETAKSHRVSIWTGLKSDFGWQSERAYRAAIVCMDLYCIYICTGELLKVCCVVPNGTFLKQEGRITSVPNVTQAPCFGLCAPCTRICVPAAAAESERHQLEFQNPRAFRSHSPARHQGVPSRLTKIGREGGRGESVWHRSCGSPDELLFWHCKI